MAKFAGGVSVDKKGYLVIKAGKHRDRRVHIMIAEAMLGRELTADEDVDHRNADKLDCDWRNLKVISKAEHGAVSNRQRWFLENRAEQERAEWEAWIHNGGNRPDEGQDVDITDEDIKFNPEDFPNA